MPYMAITYPFVPGNEDELRKLLAGPAEGVPPVALDASGEVVGRLLGTAVFTHDDLLIRVIHYEGDQEAVIRHIGERVTGTGVHDKLTPYLPAAHELNSIERFVDFFHERRLPCLLQMTSPEPATTAATAERSVQRA
jgi:hypothetical protein